MWLGHWNLDIGAWYSMNPRLSLSRMIFNRGPCAILTFTCNISQQALWMRFGQLARSSPLIHSPSPSPHSGKIYVHGKLEQGFKLQLISLFHTCTHTHQSLRTIWQYLISTLSFSPPNIYTIVPRRTFQYHGSHQSLLYPHLSTKSP